MFTHSCCTLAACNSISKTKHMTQKINIKKLWYMIHSRWKNAMDYSKDYDCVKARVSKFEVNIYHVSSVWNKDLYVKGPGACVLGRYRYLYITFGLKILDMSFACD